MPEQTPLDLRKRARKELVRKLFMRWETNARGMHAKVYRPALLGGGSTDVTEPRGSSPLDVLYDSFWCELLHGALAREPFLAQTGAPPKTDSLQLRYLSVYPLRPDDVVVPSPAHLPSVFTEVFGGPGGFRVIKDEGSEAILHGVSILSRVTAEWVPASYFKATSIYGPSGDAITWTTVAAKLAAG
jgi:hypothetical protein